MEYLAMGIDTYLVSGYAAIMPDMVLRMVPESGLEPLT